MVTRRITTKEKEQAQLMPVTVCSVHKKGDTVLTCKLDLCLPANNGPKCVGGNALIDSSMIDDMWIIDQQIPFQKAVVWI